MKKVKGSNYYIKKRGGIKYGLRKFISLTLIIMLMLSAFPSWSLYAQTEASGAVDQMLSEFIEAPDTNPTGDGGQETSLIEDSDAGSGTVNTEELPLAGTTPAGDGEQATSLVDENDFDSGSSIIIDLPPAGTNPAGDGEEERGLVEESDPDSGSNITEELPPAGTNPAGDGEEETGLIEEGDPDSGSNITEELPPAGTNPAGDREEETGLIEEIDPDSESNIIEELPPAGTNPAGDGDEEPGLIEEIDPELEELPPLEALPEEQEPEMFMSSLSMSYTMEAPGEIVLGSVYSVTPFPALSTQYFTFTIPAAGGSYNISYSTMAGPVLGMNLGTVSEASFEQLAAHSQGQIQYSFPVTDTPTQYYLQMENTGSELEVSLLVEENIPPISGSMYEPGTIELGQRYKINNFAYNSTQCFTFEIVTPGNYEVAYTPSPGMELELYFGELYLPAGGGYSWSQLKADINGALYYKFTEPGTYALQMDNYSIAGSLVFAVQEATTPPPVVVEGTIIPSTTSGSTDGTLMELGPDDYEVKIFSFEAEAGKRYSAVAYKVSGDEWARLNGSFSDAFGAGEVSWGGGGFGLNIEGLPLATYEAKSSGTYYLNLQSGSLPCSFRIKIYSNTPASPVISPDYLPDGTNTPAPITITADDGADIYYHYSSVDDSRYTYSASFSLDIDTMLTAYAVHDGIYSRAVGSWYSFSDTKYPDFSPSITTQPAGALISITGAEEGDQVYYTTDGTHPYNSTTRKDYAEYPDIRVGTEGLELSAIIKNAQEVYGNTNWISYVRGTARPYISNIPGQSGNPGNVGDAFYAVLASSEGAVIYYTLDGTEATTSSTVYTNPIPVQSNTRIRAIAVQDGISSTEMNEFLYVTQPRSISIGDTVTGMSGHSYGEWFSFSISDSGIYHFNLIPDNLASHGFVYYYDYWYGSHYPVTLYNEEGTLLSNGRLHPIDDPNAMKYNFTSPGTYQLKISSHSSSDDKFSLQIVPGIKAPVPSIPVDHNYYSIAYIKEGLLTLSTAESGGEIFYTLDGTEPAMVEGGSTYKFVDPIALSTTEIYQQITVKAITVINGGTENASASEVKTFIYRVVPGGLTLNGIRYGYYGDYSFNETSVYSSDSYTIRASVPSESYAGYAISSLDFAIKLADGNDTWIPLGNLTGSASSLAYTKTVTWTYQQSPFAGNAILAATAQDVAGNSFRYEIPIHIQMNTPTAPSNLTATPVEGGVELNWDAATYVEGYSFYYLIYRGTSADQFTELLGSVYGSSDTSYTDVISDLSIPLYYYGVKADTYYYGGGRSSDFSNVVSATALEDSTAPVIDEEDGIYIPNNDVISSSTNMYIYASDNSGLKEIKAEVSVQGQNNWQTAGISTGTGLSYLQFNLSNLTGLDDGRYDLKASATDYSNNTISQLASFTLDNTPPPAPVLLAEERPGCIKLSFDQSAEDVYSYQLYYKAHDAVEFQNYINLYSNDAYYHNLLTYIGSNYDYKIRAIDEAGNQGEFSPVQSATVQAFSPSFTIIPDAAKPGEVLNISAIGFLANEYIYLYLDDSNIRGANANGEGEVTFAYNIANGLTGDHRFRLEGYTSKAKVIKTYTINDYVPSITAPATADAGDTITVNVDQFGWVPAYYSRTVKLYLDGVEKDYIYLYNNNESGVIFAGSKTIQIPYTATGVLEIRAESSDGYSAIASINVTPSGAEISASPEDKRSGDTIIIAVSGFAAGERVYFYKGGSSSYFQYLNCDNEGNGSISYRLGKDEIGSVYFEARGNSSGIKRGVVYQSLPAQLLIMGPASIYAGTPANFSVSGFNQNEYVYIYINGVYKYSAYAYAGSTTSHSITINEVGNALITAVGQTSGMTVSMTSQVKNPSALAPVLVSMAENYEAGSTVTLNASGFKAYEGIKFYINNAEISTKTADAVGNGSTTYMIPGETPTGTNLVFSASGQSSDLTAVATVAGITEDLGISFSGTPKPGDNILTSITGSYTADTCKVYLDGKYIGNIGSFGIPAESTSFTYQLPYHTTPGVHQMVFITGNGEHANLQVTVLAPTPQVLVELQLISLSGFAAGELIDLRINGQLISDVTTDGLGSASYIPIEAFGPGEYLISARGSTSNFYASETLTIPISAASISIDPTMARPGAAINVAMTGYSPNESIKTFLGNNEVLPVAAITADATGAATATITVPLKQAAGSIALRAVGLSSGKTAEADLTVGSIVPGASVTPSSGDTIRAGEYITISAIGFPSHTDLLFSLDAITITVEGLVETNANGDLSVSYRLPASTASGTHRILVSGGGYWTSFEFAVEAQTSVLKLSASEGRAGQSIRISGDNYLMATEGDTTAQIVIGSTVISDSLILSGGSFSLDYTISADLADGNYIIKVSTSEQEEASAGFRVDNTAPLMEEVVAQASTRSITVSWPIPSDTDLNGFKVYRKSRPEDPWGQAITSLSSTYTSYTQTLGEGIELNQTYIYGVSAYDRLNNESGPASADAVTLLADVVKPNGNFYIQNFSGRMLKAGSYTFYVYANDNQGVSEIKLTSQKYTGEVDSYGNKIYADPVEVGVSVNPSPSTSYSSVVYYNASYAYTVESLAIEDGEYLFTLDIKDLAGNINSSASTYYIDTTPPQAPIAAAATGTAGSIILTWTGSGSADLSGYEIFAAESEAALADLSEPTRTVGIVSTASFEVTADSSRYFKLRAYDSAGNHSEFTAITSATATADTAEPVMKSMSPDNGYASRNATIYIGFWAQDNFRIKEFRLEYKQPGGADYIPIKTLQAGVDFTSAATGQEQYAAYYWNTEGLSGTYEIRVHAVDYSDNSSDYITATYRLDKTPPAQPAQVIAAGSSGSVEVTWDEVTDADLWGYYIYRQEQPSGNDPPQEFTYIDSRIKSEEPNLTDYGVESGKSYKYAVSSRDDLYNESQRTESNVASVANFTPQITEFSNGSDPLVIYAGDTLSIKAGGFKPYEAVDMYMDYDEEGSNQVILTRWADDKGTLATISWRYVVKTATGNHILTLKGRSSLAVANQAFTTNAPDTLPAVPGSVNISNTGVLSIKIDGYGVSGVASYNIYRRATKTLETGDDEPLALLAANVKTTTFTDLNVNNQKSYYYTVEALDAYGNAGPGLESSGLVPVQDEEPPSAIITNSLSGQIMTLYALVTDNVSVTHVAFTYHNSDQSVNEVIGSAQNPNSERGKSATVAQSWDISDLHDDSYTITALIKDRNGNSIEKTMNIVKRSQAVDYDGTVTGTADALRIKVSWTASSDPELSSYILYRRSSADHNTWDEWVQVATTSLLTYTDHGRSATTYYQYSIAVLDRYGNLSDKVLMSTPGEGYIVPLNDNDIPIIGSFSPAAGSTLNGTRNISILASDNVGVSKIELFRTDPTGSDTIEGVKYSKIGESVAGSAGFGTISFNTTTVADGNLTLLTRAADSSGNTAIKTATFMIDNTPPPVPILSAAEAELAVAVTVNSGGAAADLSHYNIYTSPSEQGDYTLLTAVKAGSYTHKEALLTGNWYYATASDMVGNESAASGKRFAQPGGDTTEPVLSNLSPTADAPLRGSVNLYAQATDNVAVSGIRFEYREEGSDTWKLAANISSLDSNGGAAYTWNTVSESGGVQLSPDGSYELRAVAYDQANNEGIVTDFYTIANDPPSPPTGLEVYSGQWQLVVSFNTVSGSDFAYYKIYRKLSAESEWTYLAQTTSNVYVDKGLNPADSYDYRVTVVNDLGRESGGIESTGIYTDTVTHNSRQQSSKPIIRQITPTNYYFNGLLTLETLVEDDIGLSSVTYEYRAESAADTDPWQPIGTVTEGIVQKSINLTPDYEGFEEMLWSATAHWDASALSPGAYEVKVSIRNMGGQDSVSTQSRVYNLVKYNTVEPVINGVSNPQTGGKLILQLSLPAATEENPTPMDYFTLYRSTDSGFVLSESTKLADRVRGNYVDTGLSNGTTYFYLATITDLAGNTSDIVTPQVSGVPTAESGLTIRSAGDIKVNPDYPVVGRDNSITATVFNAGYATAAGTVSFTYSTDNGVIWNSIGSVNIAGIVGNTSADAKINWNPAGMTAGSPVQIKASVLTSSDTTELVGERDKLQIQEFILNQEPTAIMAIKNGVTAITEGAEAPTGAIMNFSAEGSLDASPGYISEYKWHFGDGKTLAGKTVTYGYTNPGSYKVVLSVTDNLGTKTETFQNIKIIDNRPDLFIESLAWTPTDPKENDVVTIRATVGNKGKGPSNLGFLVGFYIDNTYMGYTKVADNTIIPVGGTSEVVYTWVATAGEHVVSAKANDILDALKETDKSNNSLTQSLSSTQVDFVDIKTTEISWTDQDKGRTDFNSEENFQYTVKVENISSTRDVNEPFLVSLSIDGASVAQKQINTLNRSSSTTVSFPVKPAPGIHTISVSADLINPVHLELDKNNNQLEVQTGDF
ncbi:MAG: PKD domain-containing protein, partial [Syntrophomonadaceae bacterium]|nr:PKD domain-containing protein [Syntrophomonadaceae bacterium]